GRERLLPGIPIAGTVDLTGLANGFHTLGVLAWQVRESVERFDPEGHVVPFCMAGGTDAKQFSRLGITGYGFSPLKLPPGFDYWSLFHGVDERVPVDALHFGVRVLDHALRTL
ncbi:hypothetical protein ACWDA9_30880, partial [Streptomyces sp. NPDC001193]